MISLGGLRHLRLASARAAAPRLAVARRQQSSAINTFYKTALKSNVSHVTFVVTGAIIFELIYGKATEALWESMNQGKLVHQVDWSVYREDDEEEDED
mmetsp:Transcript_7821/g.20313  ORF Transcript_7821/g.20313 Transcript_7821/m.20313 type:complete len:98 (-) Transcript_7821:301-594(-)